MCHIRTSSTRFRGCRHECHPHVLNKYATPAEILPCFPVPVLVLMIGFLLGLDGFSCAGAVRDMISVESNSAKC
jgi:hypothetical protein